MKHLLLAATAFAFAAPAVAQTGNQGMNHAMPAGGSMTAADVGVAPLTGTTPTVQTFMTSTHQHRKHALSTWPMLKTSPCSTP